MGAVDFFDCLIFTQLKKQQTAHALMMITIGMSGFSSFTALPYSSKSKESVSRLWVFLGMAYLCHHHSVIAMIDKIINQDGKSC